jgi:hypothetical protein
MRSLIAAGTLKATIKGLTQFGDRRWDPHWRQPTDLYSTFSDADFRLGLNAAQTTLGAVARLTGATLAGGSR